MNDENEIEWIKTGDPMEPQINIDIWTAERLNNEIHYMLERVIKPAEQKLELFKASKGEKMSEKDLESYHAQNNKTIAMRRVAHGSQQLISYLHASHYSLVDFLHAVDNGKDLTEAIALIRKVCHHTQTIISA